MTQISKQLSKEGFCLLRLCADLREFISLGRTRKTYLLETEDLLEYIVNSLKAIEKFVNKVLKRLKREPEDELVISNLRDFGEIRKALSWLYVLTKEAIDSDTLSIPFSLSTFLNHLGREKLCMRNMSLVVLGGSNLMYFKYNLKTLRDLTRYLSERVKGYPLLDENIGILMFPYCAAREVLINCNLFHEMGHYVYETTNLEQELYSETTALFAQFFIDENIEDKVSTPLLAWRAGRNYVSRLMLRWADEIFSDIFAIRILGPAFHFAYREIENIIPTSIKNKFSETHPADDYRFKVHYKWLIEDGWRDTLVRNVPEIFDQLVACESYGCDHFSINFKPPSYFQDIEAKLHSWMLRRFDEIVEKIEAGVSAKIGSSLEMPLDDFNKNHELLVDYLAHGVVPSTLYHDNGMRCHPKPTTVLNSGFFFYLGGMEKLLKLVKSNLGPIDKRKSCDKRLNEWLGKATEDWQILSKEGMV